MKYYIYLIKNTITSKMYIGYTKKSILQRWSQHKNRALKTHANTSFYNAIRKYGTDCWDISILFETDEMLLEEIKEKEKYFIDKFDTYKNGYNSTLGGDGVSGLSLTEETKNKISTSLKGRKKNYLRMHGKKHSQETLMKMRKPKKNKSGYQTDSFKQKMRQTQLEYSFKKRILTKEQYDTIFYYLNLGMTKKEISRIMSISYDIVKKWSCKKW